MKATGVVRRIDDLGRIVIPKEIRRNLKISEGDSLEIFVDNSDIILKKYCVLDNMLDISQKLTETFYKIYKKNIIITDKEKVISASKMLEKNYLNLGITQNIKDYIDNRSEMFVNDSNIVIGGKLESNYFMIPIIATSDAVGSIILIDNDISEYDKDLIRLINAILVKNIEE